MIKPFQLYARHLSKQGKHSKALMWSKYHDVSILSKAGMHLSVLELCSLPSSERALAYIHTHNFEDAHKIIKSQKFTKKVKNNLLGRLAFFEPQKVLDSFSIDELSCDISFYCTLQCHGYETANNLPFVEQVSPLLRCSAELMEGNMEKSLNFFSDFWQSYSLPVPVFENGESFDLAKVFCQDSFPDASASYSDSLVSVVLTAYNEEKYLPMAVNSLLKQTWKNLEIILVNDGSTDDTLSIAKQLEQTDSRIKVINLEKNQGLWLAKNIGFTHCKGQFITMHDADDWSHPLKIEQQICPLLENKKLQATSSFYFRIDEQSKRLFARNIAQMVSWNPSSFMFRSLMFQKIGNFLDGGLGHDCEYVTRLETVFGPKTHLCIRSPLSIGLNRKKSLSNQFRGADAGGLQKRLEDWEKWRRLHVDCLLRKQSLAFENKNCGCPQ